MLHWFLRYNIMNQPYVCIYPFPLGPLSRLHTSPRSAASSRPGHLRPHPADPAPPGPALTQTPSAQSSQTSRFQTIRQPPKRWPLLFFSIVALLFQIPSKS